MTDITVKQLEEAAQKWTDAGIDYWNLFEKATKGGHSVCWVQDNEGRLCIFTRGEYKHYLLDAAKDNVGPVIEFGGSVE